MTADEDDLRTLAQERRVVKECLYEAFWYRSLPMAVVSGAGVYQLVKSRKLKPNRRFGAFPKILGAVMVAQLVGKMSYLLSDACLDKFIRIAPDSEISYQIRKQRGIAQPWTAVKKFEIEKPQEPNTEETFQLDEHSSITQILSSGNVDLSEEEARVLMECNDRSLYYFSSPLALLFAASLYVSQNMGWIASSRLRPPFMKAPKVIVGATFGFLLGQVIYLNSNDCRRLLLSDAPNGQLAAAIKGKPPPVWVGFPTEQPNNEGYILATAGKDDHGPIDIDVAKIGMPAESQMSKR